MRRLKVGKRVKNRRLRLFAMIFLATLWLIFGVNTAQYARAEGSPNLQAEVPPANAVWLDSLNLNNMSAGWGEPHAAKSVQGNPITIDGVAYPHGVGTHAQSTMIVDLHGEATQFISAVGVDDETNGQGAVDFQVWVDGKKEADSGAIHGKEAAKLLSVNLTGAKQMMLIVNSAQNGIDFDHADWAGAMILMAPGATAKPQSVGVPVEPPRMAIPPVSLKPAIHGPLVTGATPGNPFEFLIPATGEGPLTYAAKNLPAGLSLNPHTGIITGALRKSGITEAELIVRGPRGIAHRPLLIVGGWHKLALTPPMGWNSWNAFAGEVNDQDIRQAAEVMVKSGLAAHGYQYVNIDDTWEDSRDAQGFIQSNSKFPSMPALCHFVHSLGLKIGIYSSPGPKTCGGYEGSYHHELQDAETYAKWGIDYLKYDWCSYGGVATGTGVEKFEKPYQVMRAALDKVDRDIVFSFCQYGMADVWKWGAKTGGNLWRVTGDINDSWPSVVNNGFSQSSHAKYAGPGHWNDPDMLVVGWVGWGHPHPSHLTPNEQITHISLWCLESAPLLMGCDLTKLNRFTLALLTNDEALAINQDPLGKVASRVEQTPFTQVWARPLYDGTHAVGLFNLGPLDAPVTVHWSALGIKGRQPVRDLWLHKNVGVYDGSYTVKVPAHGAVLLKIGHPKKVNLLSLYRKVMQQNP